jgi:glycosyltransferase involved in cell wall biosynthesis
MCSVVTVAIPVLNGGPQLAELLEAVARQRVQAEVEVMICDSGSSDGSPQLARAHGATVIEIAQSQFSHGGTRNLLMARSRGEHVAFVTQDALPADDLWLSRLLSGFDLTPDVGLVFGPYLPRPDASPMTARELTDWFGGFSPGREPRLDRLDADERDLPTRALLGRRGFFTDANGCVSRRAWEQVPFRRIAYAEDHALAHDMMRAGFAKVFVPEAGVIHSHDYSTWDWLRRAFDEGRALNELYGWQQSIRPRAAGLNVWGRVGADWRWSRAQSSPPRGVAALRFLVAATGHHLARTTGVALGARADRLPGALAGRLSHERRVV